jgi:hypothetical protein
MYYIHICLEGPRKNMKLPEATFDVEKYYKWDEKSMSPY